MNTRPGQTLLETVIAAGIIITAVVSSITLIISTINSGRVSQDRIEAANFAREGIEVVRGIRDSNWLKRHANTLDNGPLPTCSSTQLPPCDSTVQWNDTGNITDGFVDLGSVAGKQYVARFNPGTGWFLELLSVGNDSSICYRTLGNYYSQRASPGCVKTKFSRVITIKTVTETPSGLGLDVVALDVTASVQWLGRTAHAPLVAEELLYDWR